MNKETFEVGDTVYFVTYYMVKFVDDIKNFMIEEGKITTIQNTTNEEQILTVDGCLRFYLGAEESFVSHNKDLVMEKAKEYARNIVNTLTEQYNKDKAKYEALF